MITRIEPNLEGRWPLTKTTLQVASMDAQCRSLGPGTRAVVWLQGCCFRCPGCIAPEMLKFRGGSPTPVEALADQLLALDGIDGVTFSGGEPFMQAPALASLIDRIRVRRDLSFMSYTGFTLDELRARGEQGQLDLLSRLDLLVDGRYRRDEHTTLLWRGSQNQQIHFLSDRHADLRSSVNHPTVSLDVTIDEDGSFHWTGISPKGFRQAIERGMRSRGVIARPTGGSQ